MLYALKCRWCQSYMPIIVPKRGRILAQCKVCGATEFIPKKKQDLIPKVAEQISESQLPKETLEWLKTKTTEATKVEA